MNFNHLFSKSLLTAAATYSLMGATALAATDISDTPLAVRNLAQPNIMFMLDNSGSMSNIVPEAPFDPNITYLSLGPGANACNATAVLAGGVAAPNFPTNVSYDVAIRNSNGNIFIKQNTATFTFGATTACFSPTLRYNARLLGNGVGATTALCGSNFPCFRPDGYLAAVYTGNYLNWYFGAAATYSTSANFGANGRRKAGTQTRLQIAQTSANTVISTLTNARVGLSSYNGTDGGTLLQVIDNLTAAKKTALTASVNALTPAGATPLAETLSDIGRYFATGYTGDLKLHPGQVNESLASVNTVFNNHSFNNASGVATPPAPIQFFCQKSFAVLMTDGRPQFDRAISAELRDYAGDCEATLIPRRCIAAPTAETTALPAGTLTNATWANGTLQNGTQIGRSYEGFGSDYLDDVANGLFDIDLRPDLLATVTTDPKKNNVATYVIGFADEQVLNDPLLTSTASKGGGEAYFTATQAGLVTAFQNALTSIQGQESAAAAVAVSNANVIPGDNFAYTSSYNSGTWTGTLLKRPIDVLTGDVDSAAAAVWSAHPLLNARTSANRYIATHNGSDGSAGRGLQFQPAGPGGGPTVKLTAALQDLLNTPSTTDGANVLAYLRGVRTGEPTNTYRMRSTLLGDIINARPVVVNKPSANFTDTGYTAFKASTAQVNRVSMVYQGANDGMLHAFRASDGEEEWAYIPNLVFANLNIRTRTGAAFVHRFYVDGSPFSSDVDFNNTPGNNSVSPDWRTILVGGLNKGGFGYYALDITTPILPTAAASKEPAVADKVLWEFPKSITDNVSTNADGRDRVTPNMGYSHGTPIIAKVADGGWVVLLTSGYNNGTGSDSSGGDGNGYLYVVDAKTGDLIRSIATSVAGTPSGTAISPSGLAQISAFSVNPDLDSTVTHVYGGDLKGNVWRFDLQGLRAGWSVTKLATLVDSVGNFQPITTAPRLTTTLINGSSQRLVFFGTGLYLGDSDLSGISGITPNAHAAQTQTRYGLLDNLGGEITPLRSSLQQQTFPTAGVRTTSNNPVDYSTQKGWYLDLPQTGERSVTNSRLNQGTLIFTTIIPTSTTCVPGGSSFLFQLNFLTGSSIPGFPIISLGDVLASEPVLIQLPNGVVRVQISTSGQGLVPQRTVNGVPVPPAPQIVGADTFSGLPGTAGRRISWRELLTQ